MYRRLVIKCDGPRWLDITLTRRDKGGGQTDLWSSVNGEGLSRGDRIQGKGDLLRAPNVTEFDIKDNMKVLSPPKKLIQGRGIEEHRTWTPLLRCAPLEHIGRGSNVLHHG